MCNQCEGDVETALAKINANLQLIIQHMRDMSAEIAVQNTRISNLGCQQALLRREE